MVCVVVLNRAKVPSSVLVLQVEAPCVTCVCFFAGFKRKLLIYIIKRRIPQLLFRNKGKPDGCTKKATES